MSPDQIVRAWKRADLDASVVANGAPEHPIGRIDIDDAALDLAGALDDRTEYLETFGCCQGFTQVDKCDFTALGGVFGMCTSFCLTIWMTTSSVCGAT